MWSSRFLLPVSYALPFHSRRTQDGRSFHARSCCALRSTFRTLAVSRERSADPSCGLLDVACQFSTLYSRLCRICPPIPLPSSYSASHYPRGFAIFHYCLKIMPFSYTAGEADRIFDITVTHLQMLEADPRWIGAIEPFWFVMRRSFDKRPRPIVVSREHENSDRARVGVQDAGDGLWRGVAVATRPRHYHTHRARAWRRFHRLTQCQIAHPARLEIW
jgi:hypothetical protein